MRSCTHSWPNLIWVKRYKGPTGQNISSSGRFLAKLYSIILGFHANDHIQGRGKMAVLEVHTTNDRHRGARSSDVELTILAPMYNEESNLETSISLITETLKNFHKPWELLLVNDRSTDNTLAISRELEEKIETLRITSYPLNCGRGKALRTGSEHARGRYVIYGLATSRLSSTYQLLWMKRMREKGSEWRLGVVKHLVHGQ
jgi:hypothetical protein